MAVSASLPMAAQGAGALRANRPGPKPGTTTYSCKPAGMDPKDWKVVLAGRKLAQQQARRAAAKAQILAAAEEAEAAVAAAAQVAASVAAMVAVVAAQVESVAEVVSRWLRW
eukprot:COSAG06_NODE_87_length_24962_cov_107.553795_9_plen_112_part_00